MSKNPTQKENTLYFCSGSSIAKIRSKAAYTRSMNLDSPHFLQKLFTLRMVLFASLQNHHAKSCDSSPNCLRRAPLLPRIVANFGARRVLTHSLKAR